MTANKPEAAQYRAPTFSLLLASDARIREKVGALYSVVTGSRGELVHAIFSPSKMSRKIPTSGSHIISIHNYYYYCNYLR